MRIATIALVGAALMMTAVPASSVHGQPYHAFGTAVGPDGKVYWAQVDWTGYWPGRFIVTISDVGTGAIQEYATFGAQWNAIGPVTCPFELLFYRAWNEAVPFEIEGLQGQQPCNPGPAIMVYVGHYQDYQLVLFVEPLGIV